MKVYLPVWVSASGDREWLLDGTPAENFIALLAGVLGAGYGDLSAIEGIDPAFSIAECESKFRDPCGGMYYVMEFDIGDVS